MQQVLSILSMLPQYTDAIVGVLLALITLFMLIPGDAPEKQLQAVVDFIKKFSKK